MTFIDLHLVYMALRGLPLLSILTRRIDLPWVALIGAIGIGLLQLPLLTHYLDKSNHGERSYLVANEILLAVIWGVFMLARIWLW